MACKNANILNTREQYYYIHSVAVQILFEKSSKMRTSIKEAVSNEVFQKGTHWDLCDTISRDTTGESVTHFLTMLFISLSKKKAAMALLQGVTVV